MAPPSRPPSSDGWEGDTAHASLGSNPTVTGVSAGAGTGGSAPPPGEDPVIGRSVLGNYRVERRLGSGGMGAVYLLRHKELPDTLAALKVLSTNASDQMMKERFRQEALVAAAVGSHRVVRPIDIGQFDDGLPFIVMEYIDGRSLGEELAHSGAMDVAPALQIALRVADAMVIAHRKQIIHRDLKPPNIMLVREGDNDFAVKLLDFGIARASGPIKVAHTAESAIMGTPGYMSPEAVAGLNVDGRSDVFSLGVILYEMLTGVLPFPAPAVQEAMLNVLNSEPAPPISRHRMSDLPPVPLAVEAMVARALEKDVARRFDMIEFHAALSVALEGVSAVGGPLRLASAIMPRPTPTAPRPVITPPPSFATAAPTVAGSRRRVAWALVGAVVLAAAALVAWAPWRSTPPAADRAIAPGRAAEAPAPPSIGAPIAAPAPSPAVAAVPAPEAVAPPADSQSAVRPSTPPSQPSPSAEKRPAGEPASRRRRGPAEPTRTPPAPTGAPAIAAQPAPPPAATPARKPPAASPPAAPHPAKARPAQERVLAPPEIKEQME